MANTAEWNSSTFSLTWLLFYFGNLFHSEHLTAARGSFLHTSKSTLFVHIISGTRDQQQRVKHDTDRAVEEKMAIILDVFV